MSGPGLATGFALDLPDWLIERATELPEYLGSESERLELVLDLSRRNFEANTGGPFAAIVVESESGRLVSVGVNRAVPLVCSSAHAEVMALSLAQRALGVFDLGGSGLPSHAIVVNWRPCAMCFGAVLWSGVRELMTAGGGDELQQITGFDEGPLVSNWKEELAERGIRVKDSVDQARALEVMRWFATSGRPVYNARGG
jgi:tRNA(Arg) A34 adenosine deaminase TadA